jgi:hypothetical protein
MDKKSKFLLALFFAIIVVSIGATYYRYMVLEKFEVTESE